MLELVLRGTSIGWEKHVTIFNIRDHRNIFLVVKNELGRGSIEAKIIDAALDQMEALDDLA